ncbi:MAG: hypothetical protein QOG10_1249 [Kribbellaceae bacterium]|nr:hypothetical protein [Kribbellaceae bacterium]
MGGATFADWRRVFEDAAELRKRDSGPPWQAGGALDRAVVRSIQRFQAGEDGDGASLISKSARAGDPAYLAAVRLFVAEEQHHARLLEQLLVNAGGSTVGGHWSDKVFVTLRRPLGLRLELMTLMVAEVVALRYYRALREGSEDPVLTDVAARILADEQRHVPFHAQRLRDGFDDLPRLARIAAAAYWWVLMLGAVGVVAVDHAPALRHLGVHPLRFMADTAVLFRPVVAEVLLDGDGDGDGDGVGVYGRA